jgi:hypothetical protein
MAARLEHVHVWGYAVAATLQACQWYRVLAEGVNCLLPSSRMIMHNGHTAVVGGGSILPYTWVALLSACLHAGAVTLSQGCWCFHRDHRCGQLRITVGVFQRAC